MYQVATLKTALARKEGEEKHLKHSLSLSPERFRMKSTGSSPLHPSRKSIGDSSGGRKQPMEDIGNIEVHNQVSNTIHGVYESCYLVG